LYIIIIIIIMNPLGWFGLKEIILKRAFNEDRATYTGVIWLRTETGGTIL
jgi:hypothetical protein